MDISDHILPIDTYVKGILTPKGRERACLEGEMLAVIKIDLTSTSGGVNSHN